MSNAKQLICLSDCEGEVRFFNAEDLERQLLAAEGIDFNGVLKSAVRRFANQVKTTRDLQKEYFRTRSESTLKRSKTEEGKLDSMTLVFLQTIEKI